MKKLKKILTTLFFLSVVIASSTSAVYAQQLDKATVQQLVQSKNFVFRAQTVFPLTGAAKELTYDYEVKFLGDSIVSYLPYFGRAYAAVYPSGEGGIEFTSTHFDYKAAENKKNRWEVEIDPKDTRDVRKLEFTIYDNGRASLQVTSNNRQAISYNGYIERRK